jgi:hypothetical protein
MTKFISSFVVRRSKHSALATRPAAPPPADIESLIERIYGDTEEADSYVAELREKFENECETHRNMGGKWILPDPRTEDGIFRGMDEVQLDEDGSGLAMNENLQWVSLRAEALPFDTSAVNAWRSSSFSVTLYLAGMAILHKVVQRIVIPCVSL